MNIKLAGFVTTGLTAAVLSASLFAATPVRAESRTFAYGTVGSAVYEGGAAAARLRRFHNDGSFKRNRGKVRASRAHRRQNFNVKRRRK